MAPRRWGPVVFLLVAALGIVLYRMLPQMLGAAGGAEAAIAGALKTTEPEGLTLFIEGSADRLVSSRHAYDRIAVTVDARNGQARAVSTLDFEGKLGNVQISALGVERIPFRFAEGRWLPTSGFAPDLASAVSALESRRKSLLDKSPGRRPIAWFIRLDRDEVLVTEKYQPDFQPPTRRLRLQRRQGKLQLEDGLM